MGSQRKCDVWIVCGWVLFSKASYSFYYLPHIETSKWKPTEEERVVMESVWMQVKGACEKLKEEINAQNAHIRKILKEMSDSYCL